MAMEYIPGVSLDKLISALSLQKKKNPTIEEINSLFTEIFISFVPLDKKEEFNLSKFGDSYSHFVSALITEVAEVLDYAHQREVYHRDIKPSNIILRLVLCHRNF
ncbi:MAG: hypothetical protein AB1422_04185 [bacterium]